jgi:hypothetical protein
MTSLNRRENPCTGLLIFIPVQKLQKVPCAKTTDPKSKRREESCTGAIVIGSHPYATESSNPTVKSCKKMNQKKAEGDHRPSTPKTSLILATSCMSKIGALICTSCPPQKLR